MEIYGITQAKIRNLLCSKHAIRATDDGSGSLRILIEMLCVLCSVLIFLRLYNRLQLLLEEEISFVDLPGLGAVALIAPLLIILGNHMHS